MNRLFPPGPYRVEWPAEQGGPFTLWGRQGTPPDFTDGWAIPLVASGVESCMAALATLLNNQGFESEWSATEGALPPGWCDLIVYHFDPEPGDHHEPSQYGAKTIDPATGTEIYGYGPTPAAALRALAARLAATKAGSS